MSTQIVEKTKITTVHSDSAAPTSTASHSAAPHLTDSHTSSHTASTQTGPTIGQRVQGTMDSVQSSMTNLDNKTGFSAKMNEIDQRHGISEGVNKVARQVGDVASHMGQSLSKGQVGHAFTKAPAAGVIAEAELQKHQLGPQGVTAAIARDHPHGNQQ